MKTALDMHAEKVLGEIIVYGSSTGFDCFHVAFMYSASDLFAWRWKRKVSDALVERLKIVFVEP